MDIQHLKAELTHHRMEWNELGSHFDKTEEKILDYIRAGEIDSTIKYFETLRDIENKMRPLRNNLIFVYENLAQIAQLKGKYSEENDFKEKAEHFYKSRYYRNERSLKLIGLLNRNGIMV
ncbi:MAG: hypothetical protein V4648_05765 [Bacteroidota bacterium]